jgi:flavorubredoxin
MRVVIAYESKFGNGKKLVSYLSNLLIKQGHDVDIMSMREAKPSTIPEADLYVFSSPTHVGNAPFRVRGFLKKMRRPRSGVKYALMATCMDPPNTKATETMDERIRPYGLDKAAEDLLIKVEGIKGPLEEGYKEKIEQFAARIVR